MRSKLVNIGENVKIVFVKDRPGHDFRYALNCKKIKNKLKWKATTNINKGIMKTIDWYIKNQKYLKSISKKEYQSRIGLKV